VESLKAFSELIKIYPHSKYLIAGEGYDRPVLEEIIRKYHLENNVSLLGNRSDVPLLLAEADFFLFPSHYEGLGGALIEAMLAAKPILATRIPVVEESVKDGESAILFELKDSEDILKKMKWMITNYDQALALGVEAQRQAVIKFDINNIAEQHERLYTKVIQEYKTN
jgi:glycosyltransferase involved in cell wall biosynthesis